MTAATSWYKKSIGLGSSMCEAVVHSIAIMGSQNVGEDLYLKKTKEVCDESLRTVAKGANKLAYP